jgi:glutathione S-transferase
MLKLYTSRLGDGAAPLQPRIESEMQRHLGFLNSELAGQDYFIGNELTGADVQLSFAVQMAVKFCGEEAYPNLTAFVRRIEAREGYKRAIRKSGE